MSKSPTLASPKTKCRCSSPVSKSDSSQTKPRSVKGGSKATNGPIPRYPAEHLKPSASHRHQLDPRCDTPPMGNYPAQPHFFPQQTLPCMAMMYPPPQRPHPWAIATPLNNLGHGPTPLFGWPSVTPMPHCYGGPKFPKYVKPDYRRFCYSVGKAEVPFAALPGGPLEGWNSTFSPQLVGRRGMWVG